MKLKSNLAGAMGRTPLYFGFGNAKIKGVFTFALPAGWSCPFASACLSKSDKSSGKIKDGQHTSFRCYAASTEAIYPALRKLLWNNLAILKNKSKNQMIQIINESLPTKRDRSIIRIHTHGDFFSQDYFDAWMTVAKLNSNLFFYAYTKALPFWIKRIKSIPKNMMLNASKGGTHDLLIDKYKLKSVEVVFSTEEAAEKKIGIDHDDSLAMSGTVRKFGLLIHGTQAAGSEASKAWQAAKKIGAGYSARNPKRISPYIV